MPTPRPVRLRAPRKKKRFSFIKGAIVVVGAMTLTTLAIQASDSFRIPKFNMLAGAGAAHETSRCPEGMVLVSSENGGYCIDRYEEATNNDCAVADPSNQFDSNQNLANDRCTGVSEPGRLPWVNVSLHQAMTICARSQKHLATPEEWYRAALGTPDRDTKDCVVGMAGSAHGEKTGSRENCVSSYGAYDMIGNVWEWVDANVEDGSYKGRMLPEEGYVAEADTSGIASKTAAEPKAPFGGDHFFVDKTGLRGMFRGGFYGMDDKAGIYAVNTTIPPSFVGVAVGFRCAK